MSYAHSLHKRLDADLAERILASGSVKRADPAKKAGEKTPRLAWTYRAARRNQARAGKWQTPMKLHRPELIENWVPAVELNRSQWWVRATSYSYAREISPCPERPVR